MEQRPFGLAEMPYHVSVLVPSTMKRNRPIDEGRFHARIQEVADKLHKLFGGTTRWGASGTYTTRGGMTISEPVVKVESFSDNKHKPGLTKLNAWLRSKKRQWGQQTIGVEYEGGPSEEEGFHLV